MKRSFPEVRYVPVPEVRVLAVDPVSRGYGFVVLEDSPLMLVDWGVRTCTRKSSAHCELSLKTLIARYEPTALVIEDVAEARALRRASLRSFTDGIIDLVDGLALPLYSYSRAKVRTAFGGGGAVTKDGIARLLAEQFPELVARVPKARLPWQSEDTRMSIFDALSLAMTHLATTQRDRHEASLR